MPNVNTKATQIIEKVREEYGYTFEEMADLCEVATGSIQRWYTNGRAKADKIKPLEQLIENTRLPEYKVAEKIIDIYWHVRKPISITYQQLRSISGRDRLSESVVSRIHDELYERSFAFIDDCDEDGRTIYYVLRKKWLSRKISGVDEDILGDYYLNKFHEDDLDEDDL